MKIVHVIDYFQPALGYQEFFLAREQLRAGHAVTVITGDRFFPFPNYSETTARVLGPRRVGTGLRTEQGIPTLRLAVRAEARTRVWLAGLQSVLSAARPDAVHMHNVANVSAVRVAGLHRGMADTVFVCDDHMHLSVIAKRGAVGRALQRVQRVFLGRRLAAGYDHFVAIAEDTRVVMRDLYGLPEARIRVIPLGVDTERFRPDPAERARVRDTLGLGPADILFTYVGKLIRDKGPHLLVEAALQVMRGTPGVAVLCVGGADEEYVRGMRAAADAAGLGGRFHWRPPVSNEALGGYYAASDVGVWPKEESLAMLEATASGLPIIVKRAESLASRIECGNGLAYREDDSGDLAVQMRCLLSPEERRQRGAIARRVAEERYSWAGVSAAFLALYRCRGGPDAATGVKA